MSHRRLNVALVGGGSLGLEALRTLQAGPRQALGVQVVAVAVGVGVGMGVGVGEPEPVPEPEPALEPLAGGAEPGEAPDSPTALEARQRGLRILRSVEEVLALGDLDVIFDLTGDPDVARRLIAGKGPGVGFVDLEAARRILGLAESMQERARQLHLEQAFAQTLTHATEEGVVVLDRDYRIRRINEQACRRAGIAPEEAEGRFCFQVLRQVASPCNSPESP